MCPMLSIKKAKYMGLFRMIAGVLLLSILSAGVSLAKCAPPHIGISVKEAAPNSLITITGKSFRDRCNDDGGTAFPAKDIRILFVQGDLKTELGRVDANSSFEIPSTIVTIPKDAKRGSASIIVETVYERARLEIPASITVTPQN